MERRSSPPVRAAPGPCPACRGQGMDRRWAFDERVSEIEEVVRLCPACGGTGRSPPRVEVRPGAPASTWAWGLGSLL